MSPLLVYVVLASCVAAGWTQQFKVGVGIADVTGEYKHTRARAHVQPHNPLLSRVCE